MNKFIFIQDRKAWEFLDLFLLSGEVLTTANTIGRMAVGWLGVF